MNVRKAQPGDASRLAELSEVLGYPVETELMGQRLGRLLSRPEHLVLVAESEQSRVVGWIHAAEHDLLEIGTTCEILGLVVAADQRGRGVGRCLVEQVELWAAQREITQVSVRSNAVRTESHPFYERMGYVRIKTQHAYRKRIY